jgi:vitamin B12/bleomycin/antimicrobial peptide transport system ATP-binding/permease protein
MSINKPPKFTRAVLRQMWRVARPYLFGDKKRYARGMLALLLALSLAVGGVNVIMSYAGRDFMNALAAKDQPLFYHSLWLYLGTFVAAIIIAAYYRFVEQSLANRWREWLTRLLIKRYFNNRAYYRLRSSETIDNPDQRIGEDVRNFTGTALSFFLILLNAVVMVIAFSGVLWSISHLLTAVLVGYALFGTFASYLIGRRLVGFHYLQYGREADQRYGLIRVRDHAESIAFYRGERREFRDLLARLSAVIGNMVMIIRWNRNLAFFTTGYNYFALALPVLVVAPLFFAGKIGFGEITQATGAFAGLLGALSIVITQFDGLSAFVAGVTRVGALWDDLDEHDLEEDVDVDGSHIEVTDDHRTLSLTNLTVTTPGGEKTLLRDLSVHLKSASSLLIMGESGSGKSSLLRTIAGLWNSGEGQIGRPPLNLMMFLPQKPYMLPSGLRAQLSYPKGGDADDKEVKELMIKVNLPSIGERVDGDFDRLADWENMLSLGEQQRVSFARLLHKNPTLVFLDEATSALDEDNERRLYELLKSTNTTFVSVGHRSTLIQYHDLVLVIGKEGHWTLRPSNEVEAERARLKPIP